MARKGMGNGSNPPPSRAELYRALRLARGALRHAARYLAADGEPGVACAFTIKMLDEMLIRGGQEAKGD